MRALYLKELRELTWLGGPVALLWMLVWAFVPPARGLLGPSGQTMELTAYGSIVLGLLMGFAPFEFERQAEMRSFLVHRGLGVRTTAWTRMAAIATWTSGVVVLGLAVVSMVHLSAAVQAPGYFAHGLRALVVTTAIAGPALAAGAFAGCLGERAWLRWCALVLSGFGLASIGGAASHWELLSSRFGAWPYGAFCVATFAAGCWLAVERFVAGTCADRPIGKRVAFGSAILGVVLWTPLLFQATAYLQFMARGGAWSANAFWLRTEEGGLIQRSSQEAPPDRTSQWFTFQPADTIRLTEEEVLVFHPIGGGGIFSSSLLGNYRRWSGSPLWAFGAKGIRHRRIAVEGPWTTWIDEEIGSLVTRWWPLFGRAEFAAFRLPPAGPGPEAYRLEQGRSFATQGKFVLVLDAEGHPMAVLTSPPPDAGYRTIGLPGSDRVIEIVNAFKIALESEPTKSFAVESEVFAGESGNYVFDGEDFVAVAGYEPPQYTHRESKHDFKAVVREYDGLSYEVSLYHKDSGALVGSSRVAPGTAWEQVCAVAARVATLARPPGATVASSLWVADDDDGSETPAQSPWIDPLVLGGRRPWLVALHLAVGAALAWSTRRRLGGRGWGWPLGVMLFGLPAWFACRILEPRRAARAEASRAPLPRWAPIVDRATA
jgi:hypothetical protein